MVLYRTCACIYYLCNRDCVFTHTLEEKKKTCGSIRRRRRNYFTKTLCPRGKKKCKIDSIETGGGCECCWIVCYARCYSFFFLVITSRSAFFFIYIFFLSSSSSTFMFSYLLFFWSVEPQHSDSSDQSGRLCALSIQGVMFLRK
jgi:hypothetical protein